MRYSVLVKPMKILYSMVRENSYLKYSNYLEEVNKTVGWYHGSWNWTEVQNLLWS